MRACLCRRMRSNTFDRVVQGIETCMGIEINVYILHVQDNVYCRICVYGDRTGRLGSGGCATTSWASSRTSFPVKPFRTVPTEPENVPAKTLRDRREPFSSRKSLRLSRTSPTNPRGCRESFRQKRARAPLSFEHMLKHNVLSTGFKLCLQ